MATGIFYAHSGWRWIVLIMLVVTIVKVLISIGSNGRWSALDEWLNRLTPIVIGIQFLLGLILWILQQRWNGADPTASWEHPVTMFIATALAGSISRRVRSAPTDAAKFQTAAIGYVIVTIVVVIGVLRITEVF